MTGYCKADDLLLGNIPRPPSQSQNDAQKYVDQAAEEIDAALGFKYQTPLVFDENNATQRPSRLLIKKINVHIATGRLLMAADAAGSDDQVHQYAKYILETGTQALQMIVNGDVELVGPQPINATGSSASGPRVFSGDTESNVEAFYDRVVPVMSPTRFPFNWGGPLLPFREQRG